MTKQMKLLPKRRITPAERLDNLRSYDEEYIRLYGAVAGLDEVGRGPLAGPVVVACLLLPESSAVLGVHDSKKLSEKQRTTLSLRLLEDAQAVSYGIVDAQDIDTYNIAVATKRASWLAAEELLGQANFVLTDAMPGLQLPIPHASMVRGDNISYRIASASIVAKVYRDRMMQELDKEYPQYGFAKHKGYGTKEHMEAILKHGPCAIHRRSFLKKLLARAEKERP